MFIKGHQKNLFNYKEKMDINVMLICVLIVTITIASSEGRFVHKIDDYHIVAPDVVQQCRAGCLYKVCITIQNNQSINPINQSTNQQHY